MATGVPSRHRRLMAEPYEHSRILPPTYSPLGLQNSAAPCECRAGSRLAAGPPSRLRGKD